MRKTKTIILVIASLFASTAAFAANYQYISAADLQEDITQNGPGMIVDIQVKEEFDAHHIDGAIATYAYPVKTNDDKQKLAAVVAQAKGQDEPVVIVCPRGGGGAKRTYDYLKNQGIAESRLLILTGGQQKWPY